MIKDHAEEMNCMKLFWITDKNNNNARTLYERISDESPFITYEVPL